MEWQVWYTFLRLANPAGSRATARLVERGIADPDWLAIGGWSWGGYLTARTITQTDIFKAAIMGAGVANLVSNHAASDIAEANMAYYLGHPSTQWDLYADRSPVRQAAKLTTPTLILRGGSDARVHPTHSVKFHRALPARGPRYRQTPSPDRPDETDRRVAGEACEGCGRLDARRTRPCRVI